MFDTKSKLVGVLGVARDITERKRAESVLQESLETFQAAINTPALGFWAVNREGKLTEVNESYSRQSGYTCNELLQMHIADLDARQTPEEIQANIERITDY